MVRHTKSNAIRRSSSRSVAGGGEGTNSVGNGVASPICLPIMLFGSTIEQAARRVTPRIGVRYEIKIRVRYEFRGNPLAGQYVCCIWHALLVISFRATPRIWSIGATIARRSSIVRQITDFYG